MDPRVLREETRAEHEATEALMPLGGEQLTMEVYVRTLEILYPLLLSWEEWSAKAAPEGLRGMLAARRRSQWLAVDLKALGGGPPEDLAGTAVGWAAVAGMGDADHEGPERNAGFLGAMYVMEGSTLGGRFIARHAEATLGLTPGVGDAYFQGHGEATGAMWREVTAQIAAVPDTHAAMVVEAARRTFEAFGQALRSGAAAQKSVLG